MKRTVPDGEEGVNRESGNQAGATLDFQLRALDFNFGAWLPLKLTSNTSRVFSRLASRLHSG